MNKFKVLALICMFALMAGVSSAQLAEPRDEVKANGYTQKALFRVVNDLVEASNNRCYTDAGAANGTPASGTATTNGTLDISYTVDGVFYSVATATLIAFSSGHTTQPVLTACIYLFQIDAAGTWSSVQGNIVSSSVTPQMPRPTTGNCPIFAVKIVLASTATFVPGTTAMTAANVTETYYDLSVRPTSLKY